jgi:hypothetical protein
MRHLLAKRLQTLTPTEAWDAHRTDELVLVELPTSSPPLQESETA